jgi:AcrR family transcriptional regulator
MTTMPEEAPPPSAGDPPDTTSGRVMARPRMSADERRESILAAARAEFSRSGYQGASTARIARAAGCSEPMLYKHFEGKQALFTAVLEQVQRAMEAAIDRVLQRDEDPLGGWIEFLPDAMNSGLYAEMVSLRKLAVTLSKEAEIRLMLMESTDRMRERVREAIERSKAGGYVRQDVDPEYVAWMWLGITLAASYRNSIEGPGGFAELLPHAVKFMRSLRPHPAGVSSTAAEAPAV